MTDCAAPLPKRELAEHALYVGTRTNSGISVVVRTLHDQSPLEPRPDLIRHSPIGFDWANGSASGSAQLALALLAHASGDDTFALANYQVFKHEIVSRLNRFRWELSAGQIIQMLRFVSCAPASSEAANPATKPDRSFDKTDRFVIALQGFRRNVRKEAKRALLHLLSSRELRPRRVHQLHIEVSITTSDARDGNDAQEP